MSNSEGSKLDVLKKAIDKDINDDLVIQDAVKKILVSSETERRRMVASLNKEEPPSKIKPGTAGEFLFACSYKQKGLNSACTPGCLKGLHAENKCDIETYEYVDGKLNRLNKVPHEKDEKVTIYLYTDTKDIPNNLYVKLKNKVPELAYITIYYRSLTDINYTFLKEVEVGVKERPKEAALPSPPTSSQSTPPPDCCPLNESNWWIWIAFIFLFLLFIFFYRAMRKQRNI